MIVVSPYAGAMPLGVTRLSVPPEQVLRAMESPPTLPTWVKWGLGLGSVALIVLMARERRSPSASPFPERHEGPT